MTFTHEHIEILLEPQHLKGLGLDHQTIMNLLGKNSSPIAIGEIFLDLAELTPEHFRRDIVDHKGNRYSKFTPTLPLTEYHKLKEFLPIA